MSDIPGTAKSDAGVTITEVFVRAHCKMHVATVLVAAAPKDTAGAAGRACRVPLWAILIVVFPIVVGAPLPDVA